MRESTDTGVGWSAVAATTGSLSVLAQDVAVVQLPPVTVATFVMVDPTAAVMVALTV